MGFGLLAFCFRLAGSFVARQGNLGLSFFALKERSSRSAFGDCDPRSGFGSSSNLPASDYPLIKVSNRIQSKDVNTFVRSSDFDGWLSNLADQKAKARILARILSATFGNFGDCEPVGEGVSEMRIHVGAGYRVYCTRTGSTVYVLLAGGKKKSQKRDIAKAKRMAQELKRTKQ